MTVVTIQPPMSYSDSEGHIDSDEYHCSDCEKRFRTSDRYFAHKEQTCPTCEKHTRKSLGRDGEADFWDCHADCEGAWGWHALIWYGDGSPPIRRFHACPMSQNNVYEQNLINAQLSMWITTLKERGYANVEFKQWYAQEFTEVPACINVR